MDSVYINTCDNGYIVDVEHGEGGLPETRVFTVFQNMVDWLTNNLAKPVEVAAAAH